MDGLTQLGIGGIFAILILREVLGFIAKRKNGSGETVQAVLREHDLSLTLRELRDALVAQTAAFQQLIQESRATLQLVQNARIRRGGN